MQRVVKCINCYVRNDRYAEHVLRYPVPGQTLRCFIPVPYTQMRSFCGKTKQVLRLFLFCYVHGNTNKPIAFAMLPRDASSTTGYPPQISVLQRNSIFNGVLTLSLDCLLNGGLPQRAILRV